MSNIYWVYLWFYSPLLDLGRLFSFLILDSSVGLPRRGISQSQGRYLHRTTQTQTKRTQTSMLQVGFEPKIPALELVKRVQALNRAATVMTIY
jgi:hypothetical protein